MPHLISPIVDGNQLRIQFNRYVQIVVIIDPILY